MENKRLLAELNKVKREIVVHGSTYSFKREQMDDYGEPTGQETNVRTVRGLFHISKSYITKGSKDGTTTHGKQKPMLLVDFNEQKNIQNGDYVSINGNKYKVVDKTNVNEYNIIVDISLEVIIDGNG